MRLRPTLSLLSLALAAAPLVATGPARADSSSWPDLAAPAAMAPDGAKDAAVVIAIEKYYAIPAVPGAVRNATDWYSWLVDSRKVPVDRVAMLRNEQASREEILARATAAAKTVQPGGTLWVLFIGHGAPSKDGKEGVLVGADAQQTPDSLYARSVRQSELTAAIGPGVASVVVIDACFSGRATGGQPIAAGLQPLLVVKSVPMAGTMLLTAGQSNEFAGPLPGVDRPAFSYLVLGALRGWGDADGNGTVTAKEAVDYARKALMVLPTGRAQTPQLVGDQPLQSLARSATERGPNLAAIVVSATPSPNAPPAATAAPAPAAAPPPVEAKPATEAKRAPAAPAAMVRIPAGTYKIGE